MLAHFYRKNNEELAIGITFIAVSPVADQEGEGQGCDAPSLKEEKTTDVYKISQKYLNTSKNPHDGSDFYNKHIC